MQTDSRKTFITPKQEIDTRLDNLRRMLREKNIDAALIVQKTDLFYFAATSQQGWLYVPAAGKPLLLIFKSFERARAESPIDEILSLASPKRIPELLTDFGYPLPASLGLELDVLPTNLYFRYRNIFAKTSLVDISFEIRLIRSIKSDYECDLIRQAAVMSDEVAAKVPELLQEGKTEVGLSGELEGYARSLGHQGVVRMRLWGSELFYGHLMCGASAAVPSYLASPTGGTGVSSFVAQGAGFNKISRDEPILVDYAFALNGYISDHTRIFCLGKLPDDLLRAHETMLAIQEEAKAAAKPGARSGDVYELMMQGARKAGLAEFFMGAGERKIRFTGHGVGLELDEFPFLAEGQELKLQANMAIALEPKVIMPGAGVVGIENTHLVTDTGLEQLGRYPDSVTYV